MLKEKRSKQVCKIAFCVVISVFGLYFSFFGKSTDKKEKVDVENVEESKESKESNMNFENDYKDKQLPDVENESNDTYTDGNQTKVYFTNTSKLDASSLPISVHEVLCEKTQCYLYSCGYDNVTELVINEEDFIDNEDEVTFLCEIPESEEKLRISYDKKDNRLQFESVIIDKIEQE